VTYVVPKLGGPAGLIRFFGRLMPASLVRGRGQHQTDRYADTAACAALESEDLREAWNTVLNRVNSFRHVAGFLGMALRLDKATTPSTDWCANAPVWIRDCLELLGAVDHPQVLPDLALDSINDRLQLGSVRLIVFLLYVETAWTRPVSLDLLEDPAREAPDPEIADVDWDLKDLAERAQSVLKRARSDLPTLDDLRFGKRLAAVCKVGQSTREALEDVATESSRADPMDQALLVDGLQRAIEMSARDEIAAIGSWAVLRRFDEEHRARNLEIYSCRFGLLGHGASQLEAIGQRYKMTRERVRQIVDKMLAAAGAQPIWAPATIKAHAAYHAKLPARREALEQDPEIRALLGPNLSLIELERFTSTFLGRNQKAEVLRNRRVVAKRVREVIVSGRKQEKIAAAVHRWAIKTVSHVGAAQTEWIAARATKETGKAVTDDDVMALLEGAHDFEWLHKETGWFWFKDSARNRLANHILRMVCVRPDPIPVDIVFAGLVRSDRDRRWSQGKEYSTGATVLPPALVIRAICTRLPFVTINGHGHISASKDCPPEEEALGHVHLEIARALRSLGGIARRGEIRERVLAACPIKKVTFEVMFGDAPFVTMIGRELFALRGFELNPTRLDQARQAIADDRRRLNLKIDLGAEEKVIEGAMSWPYTISESVLRNYNITIPQGLNAALKPGSYPISGLVSGSVEVVATDRKSYRIKGLAGTLRNIVKAGDVLRFSFDTGTQTFAIAHQDA